MSVNKFIHTCSLEVRRRNEMFVIAWLEINRGYIYNHRDYLTTGSGYNRLQRQELGIRGIISTGI